MKNDPSGYTMPRKVTILGAGSWGTALAILMASKGSATTLWARNPDVAGDLASSRENRAYLPGFPFPPALHVTSDIEEAVSDAEIVVFAVPSHGVRDVCRASVAHLGDASPGLPRAVVSATKGIENDTLLLMTDVLAVELPPVLSNRLAVLSGPSFAREVAQSLPTAVTVAASDAPIARFLQAVFSTGNFRVYTNRDMTGVQLGGALKNVIAIAAGISDGMGFGHNTRAALVTRGLAEMTRLGLALGANPLTFAGLAGLGDLVLTCTGELSRNRTVGLRLGKGETVENIISSMHMVAEGVKTAHSAFDLARRSAVEMPIAKHVFQVLHQGMDPRDAVNELLSRPHRQEFLDQASSFPL